MLAISLPAVAGGIASKLAPTNTVAPTNTIAPANKVAPATALTTLAERSSYQRTGRYAEVAELCQAYARRWPRQVRCFTFGTTPEGRSMWALAASADGKLSAAENTRLARPVVLLQGGIHAGEIDGKDAGFEALRLLLDEATANPQQARLQRTTVLFVPVFNVDGHERFGAWNRPNQRGPEEMGWRTTAQNLNLNRDYMKADAPEMQAMLALLRDWNPVIYADLHVTDGADFRHDISVQVEPALGNEPGLRAAGLQLRGAVLEDLTRQGSLPLPYYPSLVADDDPASGFAVDVATPRFSHGYWGLHGRFGVLVETHSWKDYPARVRATYHTILSLVSHAAAEGKSWLAAFREAEQRDAAIGGQPVVLAWRNGAHATIVDFQGYAYTRTPSAISGGLVTRYDPTKPQIWQVPLRDTVEPAVSVDAPRGGYLVPAAWANLVRPRLELHGIAYRTIGGTGPGSHGPGNNGTSTADASIAGEQFKAGAVKSANASFEGHVRQDLQGQWSATRVTPRAGDLFVPIAQARSRVAMALLEPQAPDSLAAWGEFATAFERKEYMEAYVAEQVATRMLAEEPALAAEFNAKLAADPAFAASPEARLDFFYWRHPAADTRYRVYPVSRLDAAP